MLRAAFPGARPHLLHLPAAAALHFWGTLADFRHHPPLKPVSSVQSYFTNYHPDVNLVPNISYFRPPYAYGSGTSRQDPGFARRSRWCTTHATPPDSHMVTDDSPGHHPFYLHQTLIRHHALFLFASPTMV